MRSDGADQSSQKRFKTPQEIMCKTSAAQSNCSLWCRQISRLNLGIQNNDTIFKMSSIPPSRTIIQPEASSEHLKCRSSPRKRSQSVWGMKSKDEKNSSRFEILAKHREKVLKIRGRLKFTHLIIRACWTRNQSPEGPQLQKWMCSVVVLGCWL